MENSITNELDALFNELVVAKIAAKIDDSLTSTVDELRQVSTSLKNSNNDDALVELKSCLAESNEKMMENLSQTNALSVQSAMKEFEQCLEDNLSSGNMEVSFGSYVDLQFGILNKKIDECQNECKNCEEKVSAVTTELGDKINAMRQLEHKLDKMLPQISAMLEEERNMIIRGNDDLCKKLDYTNSLEKASIMRNGENISALKEELEKMKYTSDVAPVLERLEESKKILRTISDEKTITAIQEVKQLEKTHYAQQSKLNKVLVATNIISLLGIAAMIALNFIKIL